MTEHVPRIAGKVLRETLDTLVVLDVRSEKDWRASRFKIPGAVRESPGQEHRWMEKYPKDGVYVLYCA
jgi:rhodanese-related sulfurtransferase